MPNKNDIKKKSIKKYQVTYPQNRKKMAGKNKRH